MESVRNLALCLPSTASTFGKRDSVVLYPLWSLLWVLHGALKLWENWQDCTFLHLSSTEPLGHGHKMYPCVWPVWSPGPPFHTERVSTGLLLWKSHHCKEKGRLWGVAMQAILRMLDRRNVTARSWLYHLMQDHACTSHSYPHTSSVHQRWVLAAVSPLWAQGLLLGSPICGTSASEPGKWAGSASPGW